MSRHHKLSICYSHQDHELRLEVQRALAPLVAEGLLETWCDSDIAMGDDWRERILVEFRRSMFAVLLLSPGFFESRFIVQWELPLLRRLRGEGLHVLPLVVRPCNWSDDEFLRHMQVRPHGGVALTDLPVGDRTRELRALGSFLRDRIAHRQGHLAPLQGYNDDLAEDAFCRGRECLRRGNPELARELFTTAQKHRPDHAPTLYQHALAMLIDRRPKKMRAREVVQAIRLLERAYELDRQAHYYHMLMLIKWDHYEENATRCEPPTPRQMLTAPGVWPPSRDCLGEVREALGMVSPMQNWLVDRYHVMWGNHG